MIFTVSGRTQAAPLTAWLRVPLDWFQSATMPVFPDETHNDIRRTFVPLHAQYCKRNFCGFCGTPLTYWSESPPEEADYMSVTVGSLFAEAQGALEDLDLLPKEADIGTESAPRELHPLSVVSASSSREELGPGQPQISVGRRSEAVDGIPWFEEMIEGSRLGRFGRRRRGMGGSVDSPVQVEWEVSEWHESQQTGPNASTGESSVSGLERIAAKRKTSEVRDRATCLSYCVGSPLGS